MTTGSLVGRSPRCVLELSKIGQRAAQVAAGLTVGGVVTLAAFFTAGEPWGTINDGLSMALAGATLPIAIGLARRNPGSMGLLLGAGLDVIGAAVTTAFTSMGACPASWAVRRSSDAGSSWLVWRLGRSPRRDAWRRSLSLVARASWLPPSASRLVGWRARWRPLVSSRH